MNAENPPDIFAAFASFLSKAEKTNKQKNKKAKKRGGLCADLLLKLKEEKQSELLKEQ